MASCFYTPDEISKFINKINGLIVEIQTTKKETDPSLWKMEYDDIYEKLLDIVEMAGGNIINAHELYQNLPISKYESFSSYVYNNDINMITLRKGSNERTKMLRAKRKETNCPECSHPLTIINGAAVCQACGYTSDIKGSVPNTRSSSDSSKHTYKQLDAITGIKKPPANITKIINYISLWLTDLKYIHAWLVSNNRLQTWMKKYRQITCDSISLSFFNRVIERKPENMWECDVYKLFTDELYALLENAKRYSKIKSSNMEALSREEIINIFREYARENKNKIPDITETFKYGGVKYEIGAYVSRLGLIYSSPEDGIKNEIEKVLGRSLTFPGLMFNFNDVYGQSDNVPKRYGFGQEYIYITHATFNVPFINIPPQDKDAIIQLILKFNNYYKKESYTRTGKECNAPLFCCSLTCVLMQLPYFHRYRDALKFVPTKDKGTSSHIKSEWFKFTCNNPDIVKPYMVANNEVVKNDVITEMVKNGGDGDDGDVDGEGEEEYEQLPEEIRFDDEMMF